MTSLMWSHAKHAAYGFAAGLILLALYLGIVGYLQGLDYAVNRFIELWYLMIPLIIGFGIQVGLYSCIKDSLKVGAKTAAASGGMSAGSMIACCAHHITDVAPILGVSALGIFLLEYQPAFLVIGLVSNALGIIYILNVAKKNNMRFETKFFKNLMRLNYGKIIKATAIVGIMLIAIAFILAKPPQIQQESNINLPRQTDGQSDVTFDVDPLPFNANETIKFDISMNTHGVELDFDMIEISTFIADGNEFKAIKWEGPGPGGHHRNGVLIFQSLEVMPKNLKLIIRDSATRTFEWNLD